MQPFPTAPPPLLPGHQQAPRGRSAPRRRCAELVHLWEIETGHRPLVATAVHAGHQVHPELVPHLALGEHDRLREEDPSTERFTELGGTRVVVRVSRFQSDLNRSLGDTVYGGPETAWGLDVWGGGDGPPVRAVELGRRHHRGFYQAMEQLLGHAVERWGRVLVLDIHSYNHRRGGPMAPADDPFTAPEVNVGTGGLDRQRWAPVVERFRSDLAAHGVFGRRLDVRENVKFKGGHFPRWVARTFPRSVCPLAIEIKKTYMNEWTGVTHRRVVEAIRHALLAGVAAAEEALGAVDRRAAPGRRRTHAADGTR